MNLFEKELMDKVMEYAKKHHGVHPKSISMSEKYFLEMMNLLDSDLCIGLNDGKQKYIWRGLAIKPVRRCNYIECMPRKYESLPAKILKFKAKYQL